MTAREFLRQRWAERRVTSFIPIMAFGLPEFEPQSRLPASLPTAGEAATDTASPAISKP